MQPTRKRKSGQLSEQPGGVRASLFGLAPDGVYQAIPVTRDTGELLPHLFTLTLNRLAPAQGGLFSAALSLGSPPVAVSDHPALRSPDFPPQPGWCLAAATILSAPVALIYTIVYRFTRVVNSDSIQIPLPKHP